MPRPKGGKRRVQAKTAAAAKKSKKEDPRAAYQKPTMVDVSSASKRKIGVMNAARNISNLQNQTWALVHVCQLTKLLSGLACPECTETKLSVTVCEGQNAGFSSKLQLSCDECDYIQCVMSSPRLEDSDSKRISFEINRKMTVFSHEIGGSHAVLQTFSTVVGIPGMHLKTFQHQDKKVTGT